MAISYGNAAPVDKGYIFESKTDHDSREAYEGQRYSPMIQMTDAGRFVAAPYLPFIRTDFVKEFETYAVIRRHRLASVDEQGFVVPANGILKVYETDGTATYYEGRPLVYSAADYAGAGAAYGDFDVTNPPKNMHGFTGVPLISTDVNAQGVVTAGAASTDPTGGGVAGRRFVGVTSARFPIGLLTDKVLSRAGVYQYREFDPQRTLTVLTHRVILMAERAVHRRNYGQATRAAINTRNTLVGAGTALNLTSIDTAQIPAWAAQTGNDIILPGDLVACDDAGEMVRLDVRVTKFNDVTNALTANGEYPLAVMNAVVGRCAAREKVESDIALALVKTYKNSSDVGGIGTNGVEKILTRGDAMSGAEVTAIQTITEVITGAIDLEWDAAADANYGLLIHLNLL